MKIRFLILVKRSVLILQLQTLKKIQPYNPKAVLKNYFTFSYHGAVKEPSIVVILVSSTL